MTTTSKTAKRGRRAKYQRPAFDESLKVFPGIITDSAYYEKLAREMKSCSRDLAAARADAKESLVQSIAEAVPRSFAERWLGFGQGIDIDEKRRESTARLEAELGRIVSHHCGEIDDIADMRASSVTKLKGAMSAPSYYTGVRDMPENIMATLMTKADLGAPDLDEAVQSEKLTYGQFCELRKLARDRGISWSPRNWLDDSAELTYCAASKAKEVVARLDGTDADASRLDEGMAVVRGIACDGLNESGEYALDVDSNGMPTPDGMLYSFGVPSPDGEPCAGHGCVPIEKGADNG